jgi:hypothetical protein
VPSDQLVLHLPDVMEALSCLNKSLFILDMAGLTIAAVQVDAAINNVHQELASLPRVITKLDGNGLIDFSTLDRMALTMIFK